MAFVVYFLAFIYHTVSVFAPLLCGRGYSGEGDCSQSMEKILLVVCQIRAMGGDGKAGVA